MSLQTLIPAAVPFVALTSAIVTSVVAIYAAISTYTTRTGQSAAASAIELLLSTQEFSTVVASTCVVVINALDEAEEALEESENIEDALGQVDITKITIAECFEKIQEIENKLRRPYIAGIPVMQREVGGAISVGKKKIEEVQRRLAIFELKARQVQKRKSLIGKG